MNRRSVIGPIIILNVIVFLIWNISNTYINEFMIQNFLTSWVALTSGRVWTLITSVFSHFDFFHIVVNMAVLYMFGSALENVLGKSFFLKFYFTAGIVASLGHCLVSVALLDQPALPALGASGAVSGIVLLFSFMFPRQRIFLFGVIPLPALAAAILFVGLDIWGLIAQTGGHGLPIGHGAHLGGALTGALCYFFFIRRYQ